MVVSAPSCVTPPTKIAPSTVGVMSPEVGVVDVAVPLVLTSFGSVVRAPECSAITQVTSAAAPDGLQVIVNVADETILNA
jgi:hypothetical protein